MTCFFEVYFFLFVLPRLASDFTEEEFFLFSPPHLTSVFMEFLIFFLIAAAFKEFFCLFCGVASGSLEMENCVFASVFTVEIAHPLCRDM